MSHGPPSPASKDSLTSLARAGTVDSVIDFSAYNASEVADVVNTMNGKLGQESG